MTMTAPIALPPLDLRTAILTGLQRPTAKVRIPADAIASRHARYASMRQLETAQTIARAAIEKNLDPAGLHLRDGSIDWTLHRFHDGWELVATWSPMS